jgi:ribosomal-protein-alanine N-acetyltransferase
MPLAAFDNVHSPRLTLRPLAAADLADLLEVNGDPEVTQFLPYPTWQSIRDGAAWLARMETLACAGTGRQLVLVRKSDSKVIGTLLLFRYEESSGRLELGYVLGRAYWGQGFMREALDATCSYAFRSMNIRRLEAEVNPSNVASCKLLTRVGFALEGTLRKRWVAKGVTYDTNIYGYLEADWRNQK